MPLSSAISSSPSWKCYFLKSKNHYSNNLLEKIRDSVNPSIPLPTSIVEISKNTGITFPSLDAIEEKLQLFHHTSVLGGSWTDNSEKVVALLGSGNEITPIQIVLKFIKEVRGKSFTFEQFTSKIYSNNPLDKAKMDKSAKSEFLYYNIILILMLLTQVFLTLKSTDPVTVAIAFFQAMYQFDCDTDKENNILVDDEDDDQPTAPDDTDLDDSQQNDDTSDDPPTLLVTESHPPTTRNTFAMDFYHILQFFHLCQRCKVPPVLYILYNPKGSPSWLPSIYTSLGLKNSSKRFINDLSPVHDDENLLQHASKMSRKDEHWLSTMLKIHESVDNNIHRSIKEKEEKEPGFNHLEPHKKKLSLNASSLPPYDSKIGEPTEFYKSFLQKKTQFKAKELLVHRLNIDNISFHPTTPFVACL
jgi:hypothetical protein